MDRPLFAWAGVWSDAGEISSFAGILTAANLVVGRINKTMPLILDPADHLGWLDGSVKAAALRPGPADDAYYLETTGERRTTGEVLED